MDRPARSPALINAPAQTQEIFHDAETGREVAAAQRSFERELKNKVAVRSTAHVSEETVLVRAFKHFDQNDSGHLPKRSFINSVLNIGVTNFSQDVRSLQPATRTRLRVLRPSR